MSEATPRPKLELSDREKQLIELAAGGSTDTAIALKLGISEATVGTYWGRIRIKLGPYSRTELVAIVLRAEQEKALAALREENAFLVKQIEGATSSPQLDEFYHSLVENAPDAMILVTEDGAVSSANRAAHELFGYGAGAMNGIDLLELIPEQFQAVHVTHRKAYVKDPRRRFMGEHLNTPARHKSGEQFQIRASLSAINTPTGLIVMCALRRADPGQ